MIKYAIIPARAGSKRIKDKNSVDLGGYPLIAWTISTCLAAGFDTYVSTDSTWIRDISNRFGAKSFLRPPEAAQDDSDDQDVLAHASEHLRLADAECVAYMRPTTPFRNLQSISGAVATWEAAGENATSLRSIEEMAESAFKCFTWNHGYLSGLERKAFDVTGLPNQLHTPTYKGNGVIDIVRVENIRGPSLWGKRCIGFATHPTIEIDTPFELQLARLWADHKEVSFGQS